MKTISNHMTLSSSREHQAKDEVKCVKLWGQNARYMTDINHQLCLIAAGLNLANSGKIHLILLGPHWSKCVYEPH